MQALAIFWVVLFGGFAMWLVAVFLLGVGTAMVYPTLLATIGDVAHPSWRASAVGVYRLWRDLGYAVGALLAGIIGDLLGLPWAIGVIGIVTLLSGAVVAAMMTETHRVSAADASVSALSRGKVRDLLPDGMREWSCRAHSPLYD